jgi:hypothetical protein
LQYFILRDFALFNSFQKLILGLAQQMSNFKVQNID